MTKKTTAKPARTTKKTTMPAAKRTNAETPAAPTPALTKETKAKDAPTEDMLSVSDIARELNIDPKHLRAKLRKSGASADGGRWPKVKRGSKEHKALVELATTTDGES